ncbi:MAG: class I SAM-dependent methyltransferase [Endozoicomonadaceae bacterium]|nr:class I SAM-dependent methyltransferase [Endozoicomonadaceae bacterium]MCY4328583.1 class I SAM-dependent methyltransferase [Endozoicomonadaceae bacterium]
MKTSITENLDKQSYRWLSGKLYSWFMSSECNEFRLAEYALLSKIFQKLHGEFICCSGFSEQKNDAFCQNKQHCFSLGTVADKQVSILSDIHFWPIQSQSADIVLLHHVLEWTQHPQRVLREVSRVICPGGVLVILAFNPWSLSSLCRFTSACYPKEFRSVKLHSAGKIKKWLNTLGLTCETLQFIMPWAPLHYPNHAKFLLKTSQSKFPAGSVFFIIAVKEKAQFIFKSSMLHRSNSVINTSYAGAGF